MLMLKPWVNVFSAGHMEAFLSKNILPKLADCLQELVINPANQTMDNWKWVMAWKDLISAQLLVTLLDRCFFRRWLQTLVNWLNTSPTTRRLAFGTRAGKPLFRSISLVTLSSKLGVSSTCIYSCVLLTVY
ncbi:TFIP11 [Bugula neritina]|uniref:TFIP11 n=1 Tax=Bugula neritina TaxID=10212 RepID=A0A7J7IYB1_BUGNE|nr:TFIP11 [Bugula neritina]